MAELPIMPLKTDALLADTTHMTPEEFGVYVRILLAMWRHGAKLSDNPSELAIIGGVTVKKWNAIAEKVLRPMTQSGGFLSQKRLTTTWFEVQEMREKRVQAANKRWGKSHPNGHAHA